jgi:hypothetical protein
VTVGGNTTVSVRNSVAAGNNGTGFAASASSGPPAVMNLESSMASGNAEGVKADGANSTINMSNVTLANNSTGLSSINGATTNISNVTVVDNTTGLSPTNGGHIVSFGNNKITNNTTNGSPTKTISQK